MSAIYQRARPIRWEDVVGQEHIKEVLRGALSAGKIGHAYVFSGPRGVGKTTVARLIAMTANCTAENKPCGECDSCLSVRRGSHPDVFELDAASHNSVDDVRELREKVGLAAMHGGKKIYILDEAHMMTRQAFNALLKTLEEPPPHVVFILATTEPEKILPTILSRCQHYRFRRLTAEEIASKLALLAAKEGIGSEPAGLALLGKLADGAMRDGESMLERMLATGQPVTRHSVEMALGLPPTERMRDLAQHLVTGDTAAVMQAAEKLYQDGYAARSVLAGLLDTLSEALYALLRIGTVSEEAALQGATADQLLSLQATLDEQEPRFARQADLLSLQLALTHALLPRGTALSQGSLASSRQQTPNQKPAQPSSSQQSSAQQTSAMAQLERRLSNLEKKWSQSGQGQQVQPAQGNARRASDSESSVESLGPVPSGTHPKVAWEQFLRAVTQYGGQHIRAFVREADYYWEGNTFYLRFDRVDPKGKPKNRFHGQSVLKHVQVVAQAAQETFGAVTLVVQCFGEMVRVPPPQGTAAAVSLSTELAVEPVAEPPAPLPQAVQTEAKSAPVSNPVSNTVPPTASPVAAQPAIPTFEPNRSSPPARAQTTPPPIAPPPPPEEEDVPFAPQSVAEPEPIPLTVLDREPVWDLPPADFSDKGDVSKVKPPPFQPSRSTQTSSTSTRQPSVSQSSVSRSTALTTEAFLGFKERFRGNVIEVQSKATSETTPSSEDELDTDTGDND